MIKLSKWRNDIIIRDDMYYKNAAFAQFDRFQTLADELDAQIYVVSTHMSKSVLLPVVLIKGSHGRFIIRDNFYDYNLAVEWDFPIDIPLEEVYPMHDWNWYLDEMQKKEKYCHWNEWTEEELNDPRITRIEIGSSDGSKYWKDYSFEEKERWLKRFEDTEWYTRDWCSGKLIVEGKLGKGCKLYSASYPYAQGMDSYSKYGYYKRGVKKFIIAVNEVSDIVKKINGLDADHA